MKEHIDKVPVLTHFDTVYTKYHSKKYCFFGGYDYHRLGSNPAIIAEMHSAALTYGLNSSGSRQTTGTHPLHLQLEKAIADFTGHAAAILTNSGYLANITALLALQNQYSHFFFDEKIHPSIRDAMRLCATPKVAFLHQSVEDLEIKTKELAKSENFRPLVLSEATGTIYGIISPVEKYTQLAEKYGGKVFIDEAHTLGVLGKTGRGLAERAALSAEKRLSVGTLSKAFGVFGGFVCGTEEEIAAMRKVNAYVGSSAFPLNLAAGAIKSIQIISEGPSMVMNLQEKALTAKKQLNEWGISHPIYETPVIAILPKSDDEKDSLFQSLKEYEIFPSYINYPGGPANGYFRFALSSAHSNEQIDSLITAIRKGLQK
ncbi:MAG TPA: aminotransferase class I/II-fold pyridoxal phosphate-dependent enzyme [Candidatus Marinimicrobia bacterium]|nr:aminotransferase class I/II-fold pyridoxal phosphate-dependent enzyme [Candidatus Neomarinimicrobiota bacterium]